MHAMTPTHTYVHSCTYIHTCVEGQHHQCGWRRLSWQCQMWQCSMWDNVPLCSCTAPQSHCEIVILLDVAHTRWVPRTDCVPLMSAFYSTCFLFFPLAQRHYPLSCTVQSVSVFHMWCLVDVLFALVLVHVLYPICLSTNRHPSNVFCVAFVFLHKSNVMSANLPSEWPWLLPASLLVWPWRNCPWAAHKGQSGPECGG